VHWLQRWRARSPIDGMPVSIGRAQFGSQAEQVAFLRQLVEGYKSTYTIAQLARDIVFRQRQCPPKKKACHALAIASWVQDNITYVNEGEETFQTPLHTLRVGYGDCDDFTTLIGAFLESLGIPVELVAVGWAGDELPFGQKASGPWRTLFAQESFRHIFPRARISGPQGTRRLPLDATLSAPVSALTDPIELAKSMGVSSPRVLVL
jgi:transglutaminase superfamily protein